MTTSSERSTNNRRQRRKINIKWAQAFKQAPWRGQVQSAGLFLLGLVVVIVIASIYLSISGRAASAGLGAYRMNAERQTLERQIADRKAKIAVLTSVTVMEQRAKDMGFERINSTDAVYVMVPGYPGKQAVVLAAPPGIDDSNRSLVLPIYRRSIWDMLFQGINRLSESVGGGV
ncbi:MAG: hypothetical protein CVU45_03800 [Chloroflexi bacterium HGW-Chloroflexi-7]|nr:MAG: hypothetical protein CVU45_03800 [Chloroflexi bacterium HGW-Chloroflexi-7]HCS38574.1 hypothetical protein [Anaerolineaceae bacterium]